MRIAEHFIRGNPRIEIISNGGKPLPIPPAWRPVLQSDLLVAIPDMHMFMYDSALDNFKYGAEAMIDFLIHVHAVQEELAAHDQVLQLYQLGDLYELRFPSPTTGHYVTAHEIRRSHPDYDTIIRHLTALKPHLIYGNHDFEHRLFSGFKSTAFDGRVYLEHGFEADRWYHFANPNKRFWWPAMSMFRRVRKMEEAINRFRQRIGHLGEHEHSATGITSGMAERGDFPSPVGYPGRQLRHFRQMLRGKTWQAEHTRICVIGHTHHPYIDPHFADGRCIFVDAGCWTDGRTDFVVITNEELAICRYIRTPLATGATRTVRTEATGLQPGRSSVRSMSPLTRRPVAAFQQLRHPSR